MPRANPPHGRFHPRGQLGHGGMGVVLRVFDTERNQYLAEAHPVRQRRLHHSLPQAHSALADFLATLQRT